MCQILIEISVDSDFGAATESAVIAFQIVKGLKPDGIVGPDTWAALGGSGNDNAKFDIGERLNHTQAQRVLSQYNIGVRSDGGCTVIPFFFH